MGRIRMTVEKVCCYKPATVPGHQCNPLIEALPAYLEWRPSDLLRKLGQMPEMPIAEGARSQNTYWLTNLTSNLFIPTRRHYGLFVTVDLLIRHGCETRNPIGLDRETYAREASSRMALADGSFEKGLAAFLIAPPGLGKTRSLERILSLYPRLIEHVRRFSGGPFLQVTSLSVFCPTDGSVKTLCRSLLDEIGRLTGIDYGEEFHITERTRRPTLEKALVHALAFHYVGIIVVDDIDRVGCKDLLCFLGRLSRALHIPVLLAGTPKIEPFLRNCPWGIIHWQPFHEDCPEWKPFAAELWKLNRVPEAQPTMPEAIEKKLLEKSGGDVDVMLKLFILAQIRVLMLRFRRTRTKTPAALTPDVFDTLFDAYFLNLKPVFESGSGCRFELLSKLEETDLPPDIRTLVETMARDLEREGEAIFDEEELQKRDVSDALSAAMAYAGECQSITTAEIAEGLLEDILA